MSTKVKPPKLPLFFLRWFCKPDLLEDVEGDLAEIYAQHYSESKCKANFKYLADVLLLFRPGMIRNFEFSKNSNNNAMIYNFLKIAFRNAAKYKAYTFLNLFGLVVGITTSLLITLWVVDETSMDKFHVEGDNIYQVFRTMTESASSVRTTESIPKPAADLLKDEYSEVDAVALLSWQMDAPVGEGDKKVTYNGHYATPEFLSMFSFPVVLGDYENGFAAPAPILISEKLAAQQFGPAWENQALNSTLLIDGQYELTVVGVFEDIGTNSSLQFDWLVPAKLFFSENDWVDDWGNGSFQVYFTTANEENAQIIAERLHPEIMNHTKDATNSGVEYLIVHKFQDYYLYNNFTNGVVDGGRIEYVRIMSAVAIFLLVIACINFVNLTTASAIKRSKEVSVRKVLGSERKMLSLQFFSEAFFFTILASGIAVLLAELLLPYFNQIVNKNLFIDYWSFTSWQVFIGLVLFISLISGIYPAIILPSFGIVKSLHNQQKVGSTSLRKGLVITQFVISSTLIMGTLVIYQQLDFVINKDIGLDKENLLAVSINTRAPEKHQAYKTELLKSSNITAVAANSGNPVNYGRSTSSANWEGRDPNENYEVNIMLADVDFVSTLGMTMKAGRDFSRAYNDSTNFIINEVMAEIMGFDDPVGKKLSFWGIDGEVIGVVKNFHMRDLHRTIAPLIITSVNPRGYNAMMIRTNNNIEAALLDIDRITKEIYPDTEFEYAFVDTLIEQSYEAEQTVRTLASIFALISIIISCLGLYGLSSYSAEQRSKEIGIRKVQGASVVQVMVLLSKNYMLLIIIAFVLAMPLSYYFLQSWLEGFEYRITMHPGLFLIAGVISMVVGIGAMAGKTYAAARTNPINSIRID